MPGPAGWAQGEHAHGGPQLPRADQYGLKQGRIDFAPLRKKLGKELPVDVTHEMLLTYVEKHHPKAPHEYLAVLGTDPVYQGKGIGSALLPSMLERCDRDGIPSYLESSSEDSKRLYLRHGYQVTRELPLPPDGPPVWLMWRNPGGR